jgi:hypothetical protein
LWLWSGYSRVGPELTAACSTAPNSGERLCRQDLRGEASLRSPNGY